MDMLLLMECSSLLIFKCLTKNCHGVFVGIEFVIFNVKRCLTMLKEFFEVFTKENNERILTEWR